jgi:glycosyltransferase involved in cell wall biosynthesis
MKILYCNRPKSAWNGGDYVQLEETANALRNLGVEIDISEDLVVSPETISKYDIVHLWNFSMPWTKYQLWVARKHKIPTVCSMIYHESDQWIPYSNQQIMLDELQCPIFQTKGEMERVKRHLTLDENKARFIQNGINPYWKTISDRKVSMPGFVLTVGRIEPSKGQLDAAKACKELGYPYIIIGEITDKQYACDCEEAGAIIKGFMTMEELKPWYYSAKVYIQPSKAETWGLCVDEAGSQGTPVVLTTMCEREDYPFIRCEYGNQESIKSGITKAWNMEKDYTFAETLKTWDEIALSVLEIYQNL